MFGRLFLLFLIIPFIEITLLIKLGGVIGVVPTVAIMVLTAIIGARLVRQAGLTTWMEAQRRMAAGEVPGQQLAEGVLLLIAGVMLLTPGLLTDLAGIIILIPAVRARLARNMGRFVVVSSVTPPMGGRAEPGSRPQSGDTIEGEFERKE